MVVEHFFFNLVINETDDDVAVFKMTSAHQNLQGSVYVKTLPKRIFFYVVSPKMIRKNVLDEGCTCKKKNIRCHNNLYYSYGSQKLRLLSALCWSFLLRLKIVLDSWKKYIDNGQLLDILHIDFSRAFD